LLIASTLAIAPFILPWNKTVYVCTNCGATVTRDSPFGRPSPPLASPCNNALPFVHRWRYQWSNQSNCGCSHTHGDGFLSIHPPSTLAHLQELSHDDRVWFVQRYNALLDSAPYSRSYDAVYLDRTISRISDERESTSIEQMFQTAESLLKARNVRFLSSWLESPLRPRRYVAMQLLREAKIITVKNMGYLDEPLTTEQLIQVYAEFGQKPKI